MLTTAVASIEKQRPLRQHLKLVGKEDHWQQTCTEDNHLKVWDTLLKCVFFRFSEKFGHKGRTTLECLFFVVKMGFHGNIPLQMFSESLVLKFLTIRIKYFDNFFVELGLQTLQNCEKSTRQVIVRYSKSKVDFFEKARWLRFVFFSID